MAPRAPRPLQRIAPPGQVADWERTLSEATDQQIVSWLSRSWSVWRSDMLRGAAHDRGLI